MSKIIQYVRIVVIVSLECCKDVMVTSLTYPVPLDASKKGTSANLDIRIRLCWNGRIENLHLIAIPMNQHHTDEFMFNILGKLLEILDTNWKKSWLGRQLTELLTC